VTTFETQARTDADRELIAAARRVVEANPDGRHPTGAAVRDVHGRFQLRASR
jgi:hypothetical protein